MGANKALPPLPGANAGQHPDDVIRAAIQLSGLSARKFAALIMVDERTVRRWLADEVEIPGPVITLCRLIIEEPGVVNDIAHVNGL